MRGGQQAVPLDQQVKGRPLHRTSITRYVAQIPPLTKEEVEEDRSTTLRVLRSRQADKRRSLAMALLCSMVFVALYLGLWYVLDRISAKDDQVIFVDSPDGHPVLQRDGIEARLRKMNLPRGFSEELHAKGLRLRHQGQHFSIHVGGVQGPIVTCGRLDDASQIVCLLVHGPGLSANEPLKFLALEALVQGYAKADNADKEPGNV